MQSDRITMRRIAEEAGVSVMTVSRAMRANTKVSPEVRRRVLALVEKLGYHSDPALAALVAHRHGLRIRKLHAVLAVVVVIESPGPTPEIRRPGFADGLRDRARRLGYVVTIVTSASDEASLRQTAIELEERGVRGIVLFRVDSPVDELPFVWDRFACVRMSGRPSVTGTHNVMINNVQGMGIVLSELARRGYRRPGLVHMPHVSARSDQQWVCAYGLARTVLPDAHPEPLHLPEGIVDKDGRALLADWVTQNKLDCVVFAEEAWLLNWVTSAGLRVPQDVGFCSLHADFSTVAGLVRIDLMGRETADLLNSLLQANDLGWSANSSTILVPMRWQDGSTLRRPRRRPRG